MSTTTGTEAAARAMARGLALFPLPAGGRVPAPGWQKRATRDPGALAQLLEGGANVGVGCRESRVVALDLDVRHAEHSVNGLDACRAQLEIHGLTDWPQTFTVRTPSGGLHLYFRVSADCTIGSVSGRRSPLGPGIDIRGPGRRSGGYLVGPGSTVASRSYSIARDVPVAPLTDWVAGLLHDFWESLRASRP